MNQKEEEIKEKKKGLILDFRPFLNKLIKPGDFFLNSTIKILLTVNLLVNLTNWVGLFFLTRRVDKNIILHYNVYFGVDQVGCWWKIFLLPLVGLVIFLINACLSLYFYKNKEKIGSYVLLLASFLTGFCLIIASISLIMVNY